jgi:hypothetical protein
MPRKRKHDVKVNNNDSLEGLMQETYNDACLQINDVQRTINELTTGANPDGVDDLTKVAKEKGNLLKVKDSAIRVKLEIAKLQSDIIKNRGDANAAIAERGDGKVSLDDFKSIREMFKKGQNTNDELED